MTSQPQTNSAGNTAAQQQAVSSVTVENAAAAAALLLIEKQAVSSAAGPMREIIRNILRMLSVRYVIMFGGLDQPADPIRARVLTDTLVQESDRLRQYDPVPAMRAAAQDAARAGVVYAIRSDSAAEQVFDDTAAAVVQAIQQGQVDAAAERVFDDTVSGIFEAVDKAQQFVEQSPIEKFSDVVQQVSKVAQAATGVERQTAVAVATAHNGSIQEIAVARGARILWVAEPDACRVCLALSGHLADPNTGEWFDEEATFGKPGSAMSVWPPGEPLKGPPRHPHCRCVPEIWYGPALPEGHPGETSLYNQPAVASQVDLPAALRREAKRSILYGWSLPSESSTVRIDAAARLLARGAGLPRTVEARARAAVKSGKFDNRVHPSKRRTAHRQ